MTICESIKKSIISFVLATILLILFIEQPYKKNTKCLHKYINLQKTFKIANQQPPHQSPPITSQEPTTTPTNSQTINPQSSTRISFQDNPYIFEERHARLSETLEPVIRQASLSEPQ